MLDHATLSPREPAVQPGALPASGAIATRRVDPLEDDRAGDPLVLTTERRLQRVAIVAADAGARFAREGLPHDPVAWMLAPRAMFDGERAIDACQARTPFLRAILLHGLGMGLDACPEDLDELLRDDDGHDDVPVAVGPIGTGAACASGAPGQDEVRASAQGRRGAGPNGGGRGHGTCDQGMAPTADRLCTGTLDLPTGTSTRPMRAFHATFASDPDVVRSRFAERYGEDAASLASVCEGFDAADPVILQLMGSMAEAWRNALATDPSGATIARLDLVVEWELAA